MDATKSGRRLALCQVIPENSLIKGGVLWEICYGVMMLRLLLITLSMDLVIMGTIILIVAIISKFKK
ncbi:MAG: hypothetical protein J5521_00675 [Lachnospiraceae bacterium]|nr:hypothetical protein [Lachnospiraceae bacterium]